MSNVVETHQAKGPIEAHILISDYNKMTVWLFVKKFDFWDELPDIVNISQEGSPYVAYIASA